jgi:predicted dehydrogenase
VKEIGIGLIGGGYMGKAHAVAYAAVGAVFRHGSAPRLEVIARPARNRQRAMRVPMGLRARRGLAGSWWPIPKVQAVVIASPQSTHRAIAEAAFAAGKPVFCEKPLGGLAGGCARRWSRRRRRRACPT